MKIAVLWALMALPAGLSSQDESWTAQPVSMEDGIAHHLVYAMLQDHKGFMWFGTMFGLTRFDGQAYYVFRHDPLDTNSLTNDDVVHLHEDRDGVLWIATYGGGLNAWYPKRNVFAHWLHRDGDTTSLAGNYVSSVQTDDRGCAWAGTNAGLDEIDPAGHITHHGRQTSNGLFPDSADIQTLRMDRQNRLWIGTRDHGLFRFDVAQRTWTGITMPEGSQVSALAEDRHGQIWAGTADGLFRVSEDRLVLVHVMRRVTSLFAGQVLWIGTADGVFRMSGGHELTPMPGSFPSVRRFIPALCEDHTGDVWVSMYEAGTERIRSRPMARTLEYDEKTTATPDTSRSIFTIIKPPGGNKVTALSITDERTLFATTYTLFEWDGRRVEKAAWFEKSPLAGRRINALLAERQAIWVGTMVGLLRYDRTAKRSEIVAVADGRTPITQRINVLHTDSRGTLWIGTANGLAYYDTLHHRLAMFRTPSGLQPGFILSLYEDHRHYLWVGSYEGTFRLDPDRREWRRFVPDHTDSNAITNPYALAFLEDRHDRLWIGTAGGLERFDPTTERFVHERSHFEFANGVIGAIREDGRGRLWIATHRGILRWEPSTQTVTMYDATDGLPGNMFIPGVSAGSQDRMCFGNLHGLVIVDPSLTEPEAPPVKLAATMFTSWKDSREIQHCGIPDVIELAHDNHYFAVDFAAIDFDRPGKIRYAWRLEGFDPSFLGGNSTHRAMYTDVPPGSYAFVVKATDAEGKWNAEERLLRIVILPPFWRTWWFYVLCVVVTVVIAVLAYQWSVRRRIRFSLAIERARQDERENVRRKTASDFHDELGHRLTRIGLFSEVAKRRVDQPRGELVEYLDKIIDDAQNLTSETRDFIWSLDPRQDSVRDFVNHLVAFGEELFDRTGIRFSATPIDSRLQEWHIDMDVRRHVTLVLKEGMNNALRHAGANAVSLTASVTGGQLVMEFTDNGRGFDTDRVMQGHGLENMRQRAAQAGALFTCHSTSGHGTRIEIRVAVAQTAIA